MFSREINDDDDDVWLVPLLLRPPLLDHLNESIFTPQLCFYGRCNEIWVCGCDSDRPLWIKAVQKAQQRRIEFVKVRLNAVVGIKRNIQWFKKRAYWFGDPRLYVSCVLL